MELLSVDALQEAFIDRFAKGAVTRRLGRAGGSEKIYVNIDTVPPGCVSTKYHAHTAQEEFFLILQGAGTLRTKDGEQPAKPGDFLAKPQGLDHPHTFYNPGPEPLVILDIGTVERGDVCHYPDEDIYYLRDEKVSFQGDSRLTDWSSEPE